MFYVLMNIECINVCKDSVNSMIIVNTQKIFALKREVNQNIKNKKNNYSKKIPEKRTHFSTVSDSILVNLHSKGNVITNDEIQIFFSTNFKLENQL